MRFRIHRAAAEIGGNCIEVQAQGKSLLLDLGLPLAAAKPDPALLPPVPGLADGKSDDLLGIVLSHPHQDHYGLMGCAHASIPLYMGDGARRLLEAASFFTPIGRLKNPTLVYHSAQPFTVGPFVVTPVLVDHSAYDAHALIIEADGKRLVYSGDFRAHGRKAALMEALFKKPPANVDVLLMEGTVLGREDEDAPTTEAELESNIVASLRKCGGLALAYFSAQNIDRLVTFYKAATRVGRVMVVDVYTASILDGLNLRSLPSTRTGMRIFLPKRQKLQIVRGKRFDLVEPYRKQRIYASNLSATPEQWLMLFRSSMIEDAETLGCLAGGALYYSLWPGYLERDPFDLRAWADRHGMEFEIQHTSGHAAIRDLKRFAESLAPRRLIPIHTSSPETYATLFANVQVVPNAAWVDM